MFFEGTAHIEWLETWRATGAMDRDQQTFASLEQMMATLRSVSGERRVVIPTVAAATPSAEDQCHIHPQLNHTNKECRAQHPELRGNKRKPNGKFQKKSVNVAVNQEASDSDGCTTAMTAFPVTLSLAASVSGYSIDRDTLIWDSGASNHFINNRAAFTSLNKLDKPFRFDQAVNKTSLSHGGTAYVKIGNSKIMLTEALYSPQSSMNLISAGRAFRLAKVFEDREAGLLIKLVNGQRIPIARLVS
ncbi:hypothetical protein K3495_g16369, partial [Podosphaera aphanis]